MSEQRVLHEEEYRGAKLRVIDMGKTARRVRYRTSVIDPIVNGVYSSLTGSSSSSLNAAKRMVDERRRRQPEPSRDSRRESVVRDAARSLGEKLEAYAREQGEYYYAQIEPRGDYYTGESDPSSRGKAVRMSLPGESPDGRRYVFEALLSLGRDGWEATYQVFEFYGSTVRGFGETKTFKSVGPATSFVVKGYADAWKRFGTARDRGRDRTRNRAREAPGSRSRSRR